MPEPPLRRRALPERLAEEQRLSPLATRSSESRGRRVPEPDDGVRTPFERDRDRILHSKAFRRLKHKTQVFINPEGDHYVTRLTHALQVTQIARAIAASVALNEPLTEAIALGHDVGHTPFGHTGEDALDEHLDGGWHHAAQGVRIFEVLEGANLTWEVRDGIRAHTWKVEPGPSTPEGEVVRYADRIAYLSHDALDAMRAGAVAAADFPRSAHDALGVPGRAWIDRMIRGVVERSLEVGRVEMEPDLLEVMHELREFMFERVYRSPAVEARKRAAMQVVRELVEYLTAHPGELEDSYRDPDADLVTQVVDYVAGMTDRYALRLHDRWFRPVLFEEPGRAL